jgi:hypothetical protein
MHAAIVDPQAAAAAAAAGAAADEENHLLHAIRVDLT